MTKITTCKSLIEEQETKLDDLEVKIESLKYLTKTLNRLIIYNTDRQSETNEQLIIATNQQRDFLIKLRNSVVAISISTTLMLLAIVLYLLWS